jgi:hypothetical protein
VTRFALTLQTAASGATAIHALRGLLKIALRRFKMRAVSVREENSGTSRDRAGRSQQLGDRRSP